MKTSLMHELNIQGMKSRKAKRPDHTQEDRERNDALNRSPKNPQEKKLPGDYPARDDIMNRQNTERVGMDVENFSRAIGVENTNKKHEPVVTRPDSIEDEPSMAHPAVRDDGSDDGEKSESDLTEEDLQALGPKDLSMDMGEDEQLLKNRVWPVDMAGSDLDIPGSELDDEREAIGSEDEENNSYSLGGDAHEDNMEGK